MKEGREGGMEGWRERGRVEERKEQKEREKKEKEHSNIPIYTHIIHTLYYSYSLSP